MKEEPKKREFFDSLVKTFAPLAYVNAPGNELALEPEVESTNKSRVRPPMMTGSSELKTWLFQKRKKAEIWRSLASLKKSTSDL